MKEFVLAVDLDGVCGDYTAAFGEVVATETGRTVADLGPQTAWDFTSWGITDRDQFLDLHTHAVAKRRIFATMAAIEGCSETLWALSNAGVYIRIVTHRLHGKGHHAIAVSDTVTWLDAHDIPYRDLCFLGDKASVGANTYIDDGPHNIEALRDAGADAIVFDQLYNRHLGGPRANSWVELGEMIAERFETWKRAGGPAATT